MLAGKLQASQGTLTSSAKTIGQTCYSGSATKMDLCVAKRPIRAGLFKIVHKTFAKIRTRIEPKR